MRVKVLVLASGLLMSAGCRAPQVDGAECTVDADCQNQCVHREFGSYCSLGHGPGESCTDEFDCDSNLLCVNWTSRGQLCTVECALGSTCADGTTCIQLQSRFGTNLNYGACQPGSAPPPQTGGGSTMCIAAGGYYCAAAGGCVNVSCTSHQVCRWDGGFLCVQSDDSRSLCQGPVVFCPP